MSPAECWRESRASSSNTFLLEMCCCICQCCDICAEWCEGSTVKCWSGNVTRKMTADTARVWKPSLMCHNMFGKCESEKTPGINSFSLMIIFTINLRVFVFTPLQLPCADYWKVGKLIQVLSGETGMSTSTFAPFPLHYVHQWALLTSHHQQAAEWRMWWRHAKTEAIKDTEGDLRIE